MGRDPEYVKRLMDETGINKQLTWEAMSAAALKTGAVVSTHPSRGIQQLPQAVDLIGRGIKPEKIVIGHIEFFPNDDTLKELLKKGVYIGLDMIGEPEGKSNEERADIVRKIKDWVLSHPLLR